MSAVTVRRRFTVPDGNGSPWTGKEGSLAWAVCKDADTGADLSPLPTFHEYGSLGKYYVDIPLGNDQNFTGLVSFPSGSAESYYDIDIDYADVITPATAAEIDTQLSGTHGTGAWGANGAGSQLVTITATVASAAMPGVRVEALAGTVVIAVGTTDGDGEVVFQLDPGTYAIRLTLAGYTWSPTSAVVTATNIITPSSFDGTAVDDVGTGTPATGLSGVCAIGSPVLDATIDYLVAGDSYTLTRSVTGVPAGKTLAKAWLTVKYAADAIAPDADAKVVQLAIAGTLGADGQITDTGADTVAALSFILTATNSLLLVAALEYDFQVKASDGKIYTIESGTLTPYLPTTSAVA